jgi:hypothetical protein
VQYYFEGACIANHTTFVDSRDEKRQKRFFPVGVESHFTKTPNKTYWYTENMYYDVVWGNLDCCSDTIAQIHYVPPTEMYLFEYLVYRVHPFGLEKYVSETLPQKLPMKEILRRSSDLSESSNRKLYEENIRKELNKEELRKKLQTSTTII